MQSLRDRQIREVLDEDLNINRRVNDITRNKVRLSEETVAPKKTRDLEIEVSVDKLIENLNKTLEGKITALEYLLTRITRGEGEIGDAEGRRAFNAVVNNGDFITSYNQLIRLYTQPSLARATTEMIRTKFQEIKDNIDALIYGLSESVQYLFELGTPDKDIFQLVRSQAIYDFVKNALYRGSSYKIIEQGDISASVPNVLADLSDVQRAELKRLSQGDLREQSLLKLPIAIEDDEKRLEALEAEIGFKLPRQLQGTLGKRERDTIVSEYGELQGDISAFNKEQLDTWISSVRQEDASLEKQAKFLTSQIDKAEVDRREFLRLARDDPDESDEKYPLENRYAKELADVNIRLDELTQQLDDITARRVEIQTRIDNMKAQYEKVVMDRVGKFQQTVADIRPKRVGVSRAPNVYTREELERLIEGRSLADAYNDLYQIASTPSIGYRPQLPKEARGLKKIITEILSRQAVRLKQSQGKELPQPMGEYKFPFQKELPTFADDFEQRADEEQKGIDWANMGVAEDIDEEDAIQGEGRFNRRRMKRTLVPHRVMDFRDGRNDVYRMKGKGFITDIAKKFADIFS
jgi:hypothetical protein